MSETCPDRSLLLHVPEPAARHVTMRVTPEAERALRRGHPWLFDQSIGHQSHHGAPGDLAVIFDRKRRFLAVGLYDPHSAIRVRVLQHREPAPIDRDWVRARLAASIQLREPLFGNPPTAVTTGYRLVHGENDGLPGLVIDRYDQMLVLKLYTSAWIPHLKDVLSALASVSPVERMVLRLGRVMLRTSRSLWGLRDGMILSGPELDSPVLFQENRLHFEVDPVRGQKTGFYLDQRDNRVRVEELARGRSVLDLFAYTGGFSVYAARGGARSIVSVDTNRPALEAATRNFVQNCTSSGVGRATHATIAGDAFEVLAQMGKAGRRFDMVIVDPPAFAQQRTQVAQALGAYGRLTRLSLGALGSEGILVQASCSTRVDAQTFFRTIHRAAGQTGRPLREIERTGHPLDHPITFKEGAYLKCLFAIAP